MRCIEIQYQSARFQTVLLINSNMRCIEILDRADVEVQTVDKQ